MSRYLRYSLAIVLGWFCAASVWLGAVKVETGAPTESSRWTYEVNTIKQQRAQSSQSPKTVVLGGSNVHFGVRAELIAAATGRPAINMGTLASLEMPYILGWAQGSIKPSDTVLLIFEYELYADTALPNGVFVDYVFARDQQYLKTLAPAEQVGLMLSMRPDRLVEGIRAAILPPRGLTSGYQAATTDAFGDETVNTEATRTPAQIETLRSIRPLATLLNGLPSDSVAWHELSRFISWCHANDVTVIATFPATVDFAEYRRPRAQSVFTTIRQFYAQQGVPLLGTAGDFMYDWSSFYDTQYHLLDRDARANTARLIGLARPYLGGTPARAAQ